MTGEEKGLVPVESVGVVAASPGQMGNLLELALSPDVSVDKLERLMDLQERLIEKDARRAFFDALAAFQEECPEITKSRTADIATRGGGQYGYKYASLDDVERVARPVLRAHGFSYAWTTEGTENGMLNVIFILKHEAGHEERSAFPVPWATNAKMSEAQKMGGALTYGRRQSMVSGLGITTADEDVDGADGEDYITEGQVADLRAKIEEVGADEARILKTYAIAHLEALPKRLLPPVIDALEERARRSQR